MVQSLENRRLFRSEDPGEGGRDPLTDLNPDS
jgi:hypothetical protein